MLLQGPPGTGKTTTLVQCLLALFARGKRKEQHGSQEEDDDDDDDDEDDGLPPGTISIDTNPTPVAAPPTAPPPQQHWEGGTDGIDRLLVCAPSNRGVQEVLERLLTAVDKPIDEEDENGSANALELTADDLIPWRWR